MRQGNSQSHYAPRARLRLEAADVESGEAALDFAGALAGSAAVARLDLSPTGDLVEAASNLFAYLRALDETGAPRIAAAPVPHRGLGAAINDRLKRAAAPRGAVKALRLQTSWILTPGIAELQRWQAR